MKNRLLLVTCALASIALIAAPPLLRAESHTEAQEGFFAATPTANPFYGASVTIASGASAAIDWSAARVQKRTLAANTTFTFTNTNDGQSLEVFITNTSGNYTVTWPTVSWPGGSAPTQTVGAHTDKYVFTKVGSTIYGVVTANY